MVYLGAHAFFFFAELGAHAVITVENMLRHLSKIIQEQ